MKSWILPFLLTALAATLVVAVFSPDVTRDLLSGTKERIAELRERDLRDRIGSEWNDVRQQAAAGDPDAMYRLGTKMRFPSDQAFSGIEVDPPAGTELIETAADSGHLEALLTVWLAEGGRPDELVQIARRALTDHTDPGQLRHLADRLQWTAVRTCDDSVRVAAVPVINAALASGVLSTYESNRYTAFPRIYARWCDAR